jgi:hypothetical protein
MGVKRIATGPLGVDEIKLSRNIIADRNHVAVEE